jgi:sterol 3beta-glucosyltransferase
MRILMIALGSRGDVLPYLVLGSALRAAGHQVRVATFSMFAPLVEERQLAFHTIPGDPQQLLQLAGGINADRSLRGVVRLWRTIAGSFGSLAETYAAALSDPSLRTSDLLINQLPGGIFGSDLAEALGIPMILASVIPLTRTTTMPAMGFPDLPLPGYQRTTYRIAEQLVWQLFRRAIQRWRVQTLGLRPLPPWGPFARLARSQVPVLNGFSAHLVPRPPDWPAHVVITGPWLEAYDPASAWQPPSDVVRFLAAGEPPVFVGFGSMTVADPARLATLVVRALLRAGRRGIVQAGWARLPYRDLPPTIMAVGTLPFDWLFPQLAAIVHHGGAGTTAVGFRAGVPAVVVPFGFDQYYWGERLHALGVGTAPLPFRTLDEAQLAEAITAACQPSMHQRAAALGALARVEDGVRTALARIGQVTGTGT